MTSQPSLTINEKMQQSLAAAKMKAATMSGVAAASLGGVYDSVALNAQIAKARMEEELEKRRQNQPQTPKQGWSNIFSFLLRSYFSFFKKSLAYRLKRQ